MEIISINASSFDKARKSIRNQKSEKIIFSSNDDELNRKVLEKEKIQVLLINQSGRRDRMKQRDSGFNHVLGKIAKKNKVTIGINLDEIIKSKGTERTEILSRIRQNIKICNKNKLCMTFISNKPQDTHNLKSLGAVLGMPTWMLK